VAAALLMLGMALCYAATANIARLMAEELNATMIALLRNAFGVVPLLPTLLHGGVATFHTARPGLHGLRSAFNLGFMLAWFWALPHIVLADGVALMFTGPLFGALAIGFAGAPRCLMLESAGRSDYEQERFVAREAAHGARPRWARTIRPERGGRLGLQGRAQRAGRPPCCGGVERATAARGLARAAVRG
jgi:hypothetical protein